MDKHMDKLLTVYITSVPKEPKLKETEYWYINNRIYIDTNIVSLIDESLKGVDQMRHKALTECTTEWALLVDAHTIPCRYYDALIMEALKTMTPTDIACFQCERLTENDFILNPEHKREYGAFFGIRKGYEWLGRLSPKWTREGQKNRLVPCILGGAYLVNVNHYKQNLQGIWQYLFNYGKSEEAISILNWKLGFDNICLTEINIGHMFRSLPPFPQHTARMRGNVYVTHLIAADTVLELDSLNKQAGIKHQPYFPVELPKFQFKKSLAELLEFNRRFENE